MLIVLGGSNLYKEEQCRTQYMLCTRLEQQDAAQPKSTLPFCFRQTQQQRSCELQIMTEALCMCREAVSAWL